MISFSRVALALLAVAALHLQGAETAFFPIMPWNYAPNDAAVLKRIHDCGFTIAGFVLPGTLTNCEAAGLKAIVSDQRIAGFDWTKVDEAKARENVSQVVNETKASSAVFGYYLRDEPPATYFEGLAKVVSALNKAAPDKWPYINLFPDYAENWQLEATNYTDYLERFIAACHPRIISYDNYSLMDDGSVRNNYWSNLEAIRAVTRKHGIQFWNIVSSVAQFNYREPSAADLKFQAYTTLAYGGRGISYFTYFAPPVGAYRGAPVDQFGHETPAWGAMQNVNLQIQKLAPALLKLASDDVYHVGSVPAGSHGPGTNSLVTTVPGGNFLVGEFTHEDKSRYLMIVNKDTLKSHPGVPTYRQAPKRVRQVSPYSGDMVDFSGEYVWLAPGAGCLLKLDY